MLERAGQSLLGTVSFRRLSEQTRTIHFPRRLVSHSPTNLVHRTRTLFTKLLTQLQGQGVQISRFTHSSSFIHQSLSLSTRIALSRPLRAPCLPRPHPIPGNITHVGLGTARKFSTSRPIFQHIVQNVPVAGRAFYEVDWDLKLREEKNTKIRRPKKTNRKAKLADKLTEHISPPTFVTTDEEVQHYFKDPSKPLVTTYLQIPLAPTPTLRVPLSSSPSSPRLLPLPTVAKEHASHSKHAIRVSSLFRRLDAAQVWERGVTCETFGDPSGLCTILRIEFGGWTEAMVRDVLGNAGKDWCTIQELRLAPEVNSGPQDPQLSPSTQTMSSDPTNEMTFVMPDCSCSFVRENSPPSSGSSIPLSPRMLSDGESDFSLPSIPESVWEEDSVAETSSQGPSLSSTVDEWSSAAYSSPSPSWLGFSSDFTRRASSYYGGDVL